MLTMLFIMGLLALVGSSVVGGGAVVSSALNKGEIRQKVSSTVTREWEARVDAQNPEQLAAADYSRRQFAADEDYAYLIRQGFTHEKAVRACTKCYGNDIVVRRGLQRQVRRALRQRYLYNQYTSTRPSYLELV